MTDADESLEMEALRVEGANRRAHTVDLQLDLNCLGEVDPQHRPQQQCMISTEMSMVAFKNHDAC